jgi:hypothetical protein
MLPSLPSDVLNTIFNHLEITEICRIKKVSKNHYETIDAFLAKRVQQASEVAFKRLADKGHLFFKEALRGCSQTHFPEPIFSFPMQQIDSTFVNFNKLTSVSIDGRNKKSKNLSGKAVCEHPLKNDEAAIWV